jgi:uncharacterized BrkB/YihY/UPF0761 family membrane protein
LLLAGAVAYYALLSLLPMMILLVLGLSHWVTQAQLLATLQRYLEWLVPSQASAVLTDVLGFINHGVSIGVVLLGTLIFFSSLTFSILQKAMAQIFAHRCATVKRHPVVSALLPYSLLLLAGVALLGVTVISVAIQSLSQESLYAFGAEWPAPPLRPGLLRHGTGGGNPDPHPVLRRPAHRPHLHPPRPARGGGHHPDLGSHPPRPGLVFRHPVQSQRRHGSLTTAVVVLFSIELAATLLLLGAQVISEYEQLESRLGDAGGNG